MNRLKILLLCIFSILHCSGLTAWEFIDKDGDTLTFEMASPSSDLQAEEELFVSSFIGAYKDFSNDMLGVKDKEAFLHSAFTDVREYFEKGENYIVTAKKGDELIGFVEFLKNETPGQVYVAQLCVSPKYWQKGIGKELVFSVTSFMDDVKQLVAIGRRINARGKGFFSHIGFTECKYMHSGYDAKKYIGFEYDMK